MYYVIDEASEEIYFNETSLEEAIADANVKQGKCLVIDENDNILYDTQPGISYKI